MYNIHMCVCIFLKTIMFIILKCIILATVRKKLWVRIMYKMFERNEKIVFFICLILVFKNI